MNPLETMTICKTNCLIGYNFASADTRFKLKPNKMFGSVFRGPFNNNDFVPLTVNSVHALYGFYLNIITGVSKCSKPSLIWSVMDYPHWNCPKSSTSGPRKPDRICKASHPVISICTEWWNSPCTGAATLSKENSKGDFGTLSKCATPRWV